MKKTQKSLFEFVFTPLSDTAQAIYDLMVKEGRPLTLAEVRELGIDGANSDHFIALHNRGLITTKDVEKEVGEVKTRTVKIYSLADSE